METIILSKGIEHRYKKFIEPKLSKKQKRLLKELAEEIKKNLLNENGRNKK